MGASSVTNSDATRREREIRMLTLPQLWFYQPEPTKHKRARVSPRERLQVKCWESERLDWGGDGLWKDVFLLGKKVAKGRHRPSEPVSAVILSQSWGRWKGGDKARKTAQGSGRSWKAGPDPAINEELVFQQKTGGLGFCVLWTVVGLSVQELTRQPTTGPPPTRATSERTGRDGHQLQVHCGRGERAYSEFRQNFF